MNFTEKLSSSISKITQGLPSPQQLQPNKRQPSESSSQDILNALNVYTGGTYESIGEFITQYKNDYFQTAYRSLDPMTCHQMAMSSWMITGAIEAIRNPISSSEIIAVPKDKSNPNNIEMAYLNALMTNPNYIDNELTFKYNMWNDILATGSAYIEVEYDSNYNVPIALYRVPSHKITAERINGKFYFSRNDNGYKFRENQLIPIFRPNPFSNGKGLSPIVSVFTEILLDESVVEHNLRYFMTDVLKGIISLTEKMDHATATKEVKRIQEEIRQMKARGESGHMIMYGASWQAMTSSNKDMMVDTIKSGNLDAVCAVYQVPPHKVMKVESGNIGGGTGESQDETMNETLNNWAKLGLSQLNSKLLSYAGIQNTKLKFNNLTRSDAKRQAEIHSLYVEMGVLGIDEVRESIGKLALDLDATKEPTLTANRIPASKVGDQSFMSGYEPSANKNGVNQTFEPNNSILKIIDDMI